MKKLVSIVTVLAIAGLLIAALALPALAGPDDTTNVYGGLYLDQLTVVRVAKVLGLTPAELTAALQEGQTLSQIATSRNVSTDAVVAAITAPHKDSIQLRVTYGYMTQEQADALLEQLDQNARALLDRDFSGQTSGGYGNGWGAMADYCDGMMAEYGGAGGMMGGYGMGGMMGGYGGGGMMGGYGMGGMMGGYGGGGMMGPGWGGTAPNWNGVTPNSTPAPARSYRTAQSDFGSTIGRIWSSLFGGGSGFMSGGRTGGGMMSGGSGGMMGGW